jgi:hypothetical protein
MITREKHGKRGILVFLIAFSMSCFADHPFQTADPNTLAAQGWVMLFNEKDLTNWKGLLAAPNDNPINRAQLSAEKLADEQQKADESMRTHWSVKDGILCFDGSGQSLATTETYQDFELFVDWKIQPNGDSGIYLRGTPQVQIWDPEQWKIGSGGLYNNKVHPAAALKIADRPAGQWNRFFIRMRNDRVTVFLNNELVTDNVVLENYWDNSRPIFDAEQIELQCHGNPVQFRHIYIRPLPRSQEWTSLFNGFDLTGWTGDLENYPVEDGVIVCRGKNIYTQQQYGDFHLKFEFQLTPAANNGLGIRTPLAGDAAYAGMEIQILDDTDPAYASIQPWQVHGSIYGIAGAKRGVLKPVGQWNTEEVIAEGRHIKVILNGQTIIETDIEQASANGTLDGKDHPGLKNQTGHIAFLGHGSVVKFRNIYIKELLNEN